MTQTRLGELVDYLLDLFPTNADVGGYRLQVSDGPAPLDIRNNILFIGHSLVNPTFSGLATQDWAAVGRPPPTRKEVLEVNCCLRVGIGNNDMTGCRTRALAIFEAIAFAFRSSIEAVTGNGAFQQIQMARYRLYQERTGDGVSVTIDFTVTAVARV